MSYFSNKKLLLIFNTLSHTSKITLVDNYPVKPPCVAISPEEELVVLMSDVCINTYISQGLVSDQHLHLKGQMLANQLHILAL